MYQHLSSGAATATKARSLRGGALRPVTIASTVVRDLIASDLGANRNLVLNLVVRFGNLPSGC